MSTRPWRGTLIFAGTVAAVAATAAARFAGAEVVAEPQSSADVAGAPPQSSAADPSSGVSGAVAGGTSSGTSSGASSGSADGTSGAAAAPAPTTQPAAGSASAAVTIVGNTVQTRYGALQLSVTFEGADITAVEALQTPGFHRESVMINARAIPVLVQEAVAADSAAIDTVSGATVTSQAYLQSLQSAIDQHG